jgi:hypothetical protein
MPMARAAAAIEPVARTLSRSAALPGPTRAPESRTRVSFRRAMPLTVPASRDIRQRAGVAVPVSSIDDPDMLECLLVALDEGFDAIAELIRASAA